MKRSHLASRVAGSALATALLAGLVAPAARAELVAVSPGELDRAVEATSACPTFSWSALPGATAYELVALRLDRSAEPEVVWTRTVAGSATSWSPSRADCLEAGGSYAWTFRALGPDSPAPDSPEAEWAEALRFLVPGAPSEDEVAAALATLERWREARGAIAGGDSDAGASPGPAPAARRSPSRASGAAPDANLATGVAAIRGENPDNSGSSFGLFGISHSPDGAGVVARNDSAGADLILDGEANGATDALLRQDSLDRPSPNPESFDFRNSGAGVLTLKVDGVDVVTTATDQDTLGALSCPDGEVAKRVAGLWQCADDDDRLALLACSPGQIAEVDPGANWSCAADDDALASLSCPDGQIAKRISGAWACAPDDTGSSGIWTSYAEGADVRVFNAQGNRVGIGNRAMQPVGSLPSEDGALTVVHSAAQATTEYSLTMDGRGLQARSRPGIFDPLQDAPLLLNRYGGGVSIGKDAAPTRAALEAQGAVGNTMATFQRAENGQGIALVGDWPGLYANAYFDGGAKTMSGSGYSQIVNFDQADGAISFMTSTEPNTTPDVPAASLEERLRLRKDGVLLSALTQNLFNLAPVAQITLLWTLVDDGNGNLTVSEIGRWIRSAYPITLSWSSGSLYNFTLNIAFDQGPPGGLLPIVGANTLNDNPPDWSGVSRNTGGFDVLVHLRDNDWPMTNRIWDVQLLIYAYGAL